jgi:hypothetical protein
MFPVFIGVSFNIDKSKEVYPEPIFPTIAVKEGDEHLNEIF